MSRLRSASGTEGNRGRRGVALVVSVVSLFLLLAVVASTLSLGLIRNATAKTAREVDQAYVVAEAGLARAFYEVQLGADFGGGGIGNANGTVGGGSFVATIAPAFAGPAEYTISSVGTLRGVRRGVSAVIRNVGGGVGFFADTSITQSGGLIDSYNSTAGSYASQVVGGHALATGNVGSNGNIGLSGSATIWGNATPGPGYTVTGSAGVHGSTAPAASPTVIPPYTYSPPIASMGSIAATTTLNAGTYRYTQVAIGGGQTITFNGNVTLYVDNKFTISGSGVGIMNPGAKITIYQGANDVTFSGGGVINKDKLPANLQIYSASITKVTVSGSAEFFGVIHAPKAQFVDSGSAAYYGAVQAKVMTLSGGGNLHYDTALGAGAGGFQIILRRTFKP